MKVHVVNFLPESREQLIGLYHYLAAKADPVIAFDYVNSAVSIIGVFYGGQDYESKLGS